VEYSSELARFELARTLCEYACLQFDERIAALKKKDAEKDLLLRQLEELRNQLNESHLKEVTAVAEKQISDKTLGEYRERVNGLASELEKVKSENANLLGKLETMQLQNNALLEKLEPPKPATKKRPSRAAANKRPQAIKPQAGITDDQQEKNAN
jgi:predicted nuclease with TOPRIM domain